MTKANSFFDLRQLKLELNTLNYIIEVIKLNTVNIFSVNV